MRMKTQRILAALLSLVLLLALAPAGWAEGGDGTETPEAEPACYVQILPGGDGVIDDLKTAKIVVDVYKVANMTKSKMYDTYEFTATTAFAGSDDGTIAALVKDIQERLEDSEIDKAKWDLLAEGALEVVKANQGNIMQSTTYEADANGVVALTGITQGLYLVVAHTKDLDDYLRTIQAGHTSTYMDANGNPVTVTETYDRTVSIAQTMLYEYFYTAQLIAIPTKEPDENGIIKTSNPSPWIFGTETEPLKYVLKPSRTERNGILKITKTLTNYADLSKEGSYFEPATFSFSVVGRDDEDNIIYQREVSLSVTEPVTEAEVITLTDLIIGTNVTVTESYSGAHYSADKKTVTQTVKIKTPVKTTNDDGTITITGDKLNFSNYNNDYHRGGHGIENKFTFSKTKGAWSWVPAGGEGATSGSGVEEK